MATEKDLSKINQPGQATIPGQTPGGTSAISAPGAGQAPKAGSGRFVNLQKYMQAGKGQQFGEQVAGKVEGQGKESKQAVGQAAEAFKAAAAKGTAAGQAGIGGQGMTAEQLQQAGQAFGKQAIQGAGADGLGDQQIGQFQKLISGQYAGPNQLQDVAKLRAQAQAAQQMGALAQSTGGQQQLLGQLYGRPTYTGGQQKLDTLLLGGQQERLKQARQSTLGLEKATDLQARGAEAHAQRLAEADVQGRQGLRSELEAAAGQTRAEAEAQREGARSSLLDQWKNASKNTQWAAKSGESVGDWIQRTGGGAFAEDIKRGGPNFSLAEAADPAKQARLAALGRLGGGVMDMSKYTQGVDASKFKTASQRAGDVEGYIRGVQSRQSIEAEERAKKAAVDQEIAQKQAADASWDAELKRRARADSVNAAAGGNQVRARQIDQAISADEAKKENYSRMSEEERTRSAIADAPKVSFGGRQSNLTPDQQTALLQQTYDKQLENEKELKQLESAGSGPTSKPKPKPTRTGR